MTLTAECRSASERASWQSSDSPCSPGQGFAEPLLGLGAAVPRDRRVDVQLARRLVGQGDGAPLRPQGGDGLLKDRLEQLLQ
jgi:hypothetical protein